MQTCKQYLPFLRESSNKNVWSHSFGHELYMVVNVRQPAFSIQLFGFSDSIQDRLYFAFK